MKQVVLQRGYASKEIKDLYSYSLFLLRSGKLNEAKKVLECICMLDENFLSAHLALCSTCIYLEEGEAALYAARQAYRLGPDFPLVIIFLVISLLSVGDITTAGTYLGELAEKIELGQISDSKIIRMYQAQLARYEKLL